jgi:hypothetical protein
MKKMCWKKEERRKNLLLIETNRRGVNEFCGLR